ncbi:unnamed protein product [Closterium sp. NIES-65]|nr:unnamed protein product [Closterium sp. NIES-65]
MDVWGPARVRGQGCKRYFLLVVDDYSRYTTVFPLHSKGEVPDVLIPWIRTVRLQLRKRFRQDLPVLRLHSDRGGEFASDLLRDFCLMEVARTSMIHAAAPHLLWSFAVRYAAHQLNLWPRVSLPETSPTLRRMGEVGHAPVFRFWGSHAFFRDASADKLSSRAISCVFIGFPPDASGWQFYHPTTCRVLPSQDVTFDESVPFYRLFPYRTAPLPPSPLFLAPGPPPVDPLPPHGPAPSNVSQVDPLLLAEPVEVAVDSGAGGGCAARGAASGGAGPGHAEPGGAEPGVAEYEGAEPGGAESKRAEPGGAKPVGVEPGGTESGGAELGGTVFAGGPTGASSRREPLSPPQLREWFARRTRLRNGAAGAGGSVAGGTGAGGIGAVGPGGAGAASPGGARIGGTAAARAGGAARAVARDPGAEGAIAGGTGGAGAAGPGGACSGGTGAVGAGGAAVTRGTGGTRGARAAGPGGARTGGTGAA